MVRAMHISRAVTELVSGAAVLAAFTAAARALAGRAFGRAPRVPALRIRGGRGSWLAIPVRLAGRPVVLAARFAVGAPLGARRTDATFLDAGTKPIGGVPGWFARGEPGRWAYLPGWQRALARWFAVAVAVSLDAQPVWAGAVLGWLALLTGAVLFPRFQRWRYTRRVVRPIYLQLCQYLGTDPADSPARWLTVPRTFAADQDATVRLVYPVTWNPDQGRQRAIDQLIRRHLGADLIPAFGAFAATWRHAPAPPRVAPFEGYELPAHRVHLATLAGGSKFIADLQDEEPHLFVAAGTGGGKTATVSVPAAHVRAHGWLVDIIDPKRRSYIDRKTGADVLTNVPGIRVHTDIEAMLWALEEFFLSMLGVNIAVGDHTAYPAAFPQRLLVVDEFGTFASMAARMWRRERARGPSPAFGSAAANRMAGTAGRAPAGPGRPPAQRAAVRRQRQPRPIRLPAHHRRLLHFPVADDLRAGPPHRVGRKDQGPGRGGDRGSRRTDPPGPARLDARARAPPLRPHRAATPGLVHRHAAGSVDRSACDRGGPETGRSVPCHCPTRTARTRTSGNAVRCPARCPGHRPGLAPGTLAQKQLGGHHVRPGRAGPDAIIGISAAARFLGYDKPESFRRARTRHPIPGEDKLPDGRPWWTPQALRNWQGGRKIAGGRDHD